MSKFLAFADRLVLSVIHAIDRFDARVTNHYPDLVDCMIQVHRTRI